MALSLRESKAIAGIADVSYDFLPWSGHADWKGHISFRSISEKVGVGNLWQPGSKHPMTVALLETTLEKRRDCFQRLILEVVRAAIPYRQKNGKPIGPEDITKLNGLILDLGFKIPDLWDPNFLASLRLETTDWAKSRVEQALAEEQVRASKQSKRSSDLANLRTRFFGLPAMPSPQAAGLEFERILNGLFSLHGLDPRDPFRVIGEQIDGSFDLDHETYLLEAKWEKEPLSEAALLTFRGKIEGKSAYTRGVFISLNGVTAEAALSITYGKRPTFFVVNGHDLSMVLGDEVGLAEYLRQRQRVLAEEGRVVLPYGELWTGSRSRDAVPLGLSTRP
ncbi:MAG TPA: restriction endonuclease [Methylomirabilota bacterium]|nr:restriction endonuclease [Methylomirabilota bacterium]